MQSHCVQQSSDGGELIVRPRVMWETEGQIVKPSESETLYPYHVLPSKNTVYKYSM